MKIALIPGDGIGPDIIEESVKILKALGEKKGIAFEFDSYLVGGSAIDAVGTPLPEATLVGCKASDGILLGAVGGPKWDNLPGDKRPEKGLLGLRKELALYANLRPAILFSQLKSASTLKEEIIGEGIDLMVVRELTGGIYFGERGRIEEGVKKAYDVEAYDEVEVDRIARTAFEIARKRSNKLTSVDKANVLESSRLWREVVTKVAQEYPEVELQHMYVDNCAMQLIRNPRQFDVLLTSNMFGDILSDEASMLTGSLGMLPSASLGKGKLGLYEPIHGSAPDIAGENIANPIAAILSAAMMLRYSLEMSAEADLIEGAVEKVLEAGFRTKDILEPGMTLVGTKEMGSKIAEEIKKM
ncbi:MAG: 3-isopropylmalate dehydrogenase [Thermotaleaceae bacterium]